MDPTLETETIFSIPLWRGRRLYVTRMMREGHRDRLRAHVVRRIPTQSRYWIKGKGTWGDGLPHWAAIKTPEQAMTDRSNSNTADIAGRKWALLSQMKEGATIYLDTGFTCAGSGPRKVKSDGGRLYFDCVDGKHWLEGQADDGEHLIGVYPLAGERSTSAPPTDEVRPLWFIERMLGEHGAFGLMLNTGLVIAISKITAINSSPLGDWVEVDLLPDTNPCVLPLRKKGIALVAAPASNLKGSFNVRNIAGAFEIADVDA